jgi:hypothetical protein
MPVAEKDGAIYNYPMSRDGVNLRRNYVDVGPYECMVSQNLIFANGMKARFGQSLLTSEEVVSGKSILGLHRFYKTDGTKQTLAAADTVLKYLSGTSWANAKTGLTADTKLNMVTWGPLNKVYCANGVDVPFSWDGSTAADLADAPATTVQFLPFSDRLLAIYDGDLVWSASYDDTSFEVVASVGVRPNTKLHGMVHHAENRGYTGSGLDATVLLAGANGMYLFYGEDLRTPNLDPTTGAIRYGIYQLGVPVGCSAARTMCWTPKGTMWLGNDRRVWLLPFGEKNQPVPVSDVLMSFHSGMEGLESIPNAQIGNACAVYHNGFYKLTVARSGQATNNAQWWLDINRMFQDETELGWGPWYGPMLGQTISCYALQNGPGDGGVLLGGEGLSYGYVYEMDKRGIYRDIEPTTGAAKELSLAWQSYFNIMAEGSQVSNAYIAKDINALELLILNASGTATLDLDDVGATLQRSVAIPLAGDGPFWGDFYWGDSYLSDSAPARVVVNLASPLKARRLGLTVNHTTANDSFELYDVAVYVIEQRLAFE